MKKRGWICALFSTFIIALLGACATETASDNFQTDKTVAEYGTIVDFTQYFKEGDSVANVWLVDPNGKSVSIENGEIPLKTLGQYMFTHKNGDKLLINVSDKKGPIISFATKKSKYYLNEEILLDLRCIDAYDGNEVESSVAVSHEGEEIALTDGAFIPTQVGVYEVFCTAKDGFGNQSVALFTLDVEKFYPYAFETQMVSLNSIAGSKVEISQSEEVALGKEYPRYDISEKGWANISITGSGLKPYTTYNVCLNYEATGVDKESYAFMLYLSKKCYTPLCKGEKGKSSINFSVTTNAEGKYVVSYDSVLFTEDMSILWTGIKEMEVQERTPVNSYAFGNTTVKIEPISGADIFSYAVNEGGKNYFVTKRLSNADKGHATITFSGCGYEPNTKYTFVVLYDWRDSSDENFAFFILNSQGENVALGLKKNTQIEYTVETDASGNYEVMYSTLAIGKLGEVRWLGIYNKAEEKGSVYGEGISVSATCTMGGMDSKMFTEGEKAGYTRTYMTFVNEGAGTLTIEANESAGLKANTSYIVRLKTVAVAKDGVGRFYPSGTDANKWGPISAGERVTEFEVTTDASGAFKLSWNMYYSKLAYLDFVDVEIVESED